MNELFESAAETPIIRPFWRVLLSSTLVILAAIVFTCVALSVNGCSGTQTPGVVLAEARVIAHDVAVGYCSVHRAATPLILVAEAAYPAVAIPARVADAFCATVAAVEAERDRAAHSVLVNGAEPFEAPVYSLASDGFAVVAR